MQLGALTQMALLTTSRSNRATRRRDLVTEVYSWINDSLPDSVERMSQSISFGSGPELPLTRMGKARTTRTTSSTSIGLNPASARKPAAVVSRLVTNG